MADPTTAAIIKATTVVLKEAHKRGYLQQLLDMFRRKIKVLVLGSSGTGKSQLIKSLQAMLPEAIDRWNRTAAATSLKVSLHGSLFLFQDTPGEVGLQFERLRAIMDAMKGVDIIINVVAFGFHEYRGLASDALDADLKPRAEWLSRHRELEIQQILEWEPFLGGEHTTKRIITVVNKADLWWDNQLAVMDHYEKGSYALALAGSKRLSPIVKEYCSVMKQYYGQSPLSGHFDDSQRGKLRSNLVATLLSAAGKEARGES
jgi:energy-coupling factor transporter ATP-binding protein EcfA2